MGGRVTWEEEGDGRWHRAGGRGRGGGSGEKIAELGAFGRRVRVSTAGMGFCTMTKAGKYLRTFEVKSKQGYGKPREAALDGFPTLVSGFEKNR